MKKLIALTLAGLLLLTACGNNQNNKTNSEKITDTQNQETKKGNEVQDITDPIQEGDIAEERKSLNELKPKMYEALENTYDPNAKHNKDADQAFLKASKGIDKLTLDSSFESMEKIVSLCESENRYFKKSEMDLMAFNAKQIEELSNKWLEITNLKNTNRQANIIEDDKYKYEIIKSEVIENSMYPEKKILAIHIKFTNNSKEPTNIWMSQGFKAEQETDTTIELLLGANGQFPEDYYPEQVKLGNDVDIKPAATVDAIIGYDMIDPEKPVYLRPFTGNDYEIILNDKTK